MKHTLFTLLFVGLLAAPAWSLAEKEGKASKAKLVQQFDAAMESLTQKPAACDADVCMKDGQSACAPCTDNKAAWTTKLAFCKSLVNHPEGMTVVGPLFLERFDASETTAEMRDGMLMLLASAPAKGTFQFAGELFAKRPAVFAETHLVALAEAGAKRFHQVVGQRVEGDPKAGLLSAVYLALHKDARGKETLARTVAEFPSGGTSAGEMLLAAHGLRQLGHEKVWQSAQERLADAVAQALDREELCAARQHLVQAEVVHALLKRGELRISHYPAELAYMEMAEEQAAEADAEALFARLERVTPL